MCLFLYSSVDKAKVESLFVDVRDKEADEQAFLGVYSGSDGLDKVRRKRVLISSDYRTALKKKSIFDVYFELNQSHWITEQVPCVAFRRFTTKTLQELAQKYENGLVYKSAPVVKKKKPEPKSSYYDEYELDEEEELRLKHL